MSGTADPEGARAHARAQGGTRVEAMPTVPATEAGDIPTDVPAHAMLWVETIAPGGFLVYTGQPWHPQLELIARALTTHRNGAAWIMRRRTQQEIDQLVSAAGFRKVAQRIGES